MRGALAHDPGHPRTMRISTLRGIAQLATEATLGVARVVEGVHAGVLRTTGLPLAGEGGPTRGVTGFVYGAVRGTARAVGSGVGAALGAVERAVGVDDGDESPRDVAWRAALNGVLGDHLAATGNPLALAMTLRHAGSPWSPARLVAPGPSALVSIHGLCMSDVHWRTERDGQVVDHSRDAVNALGHVPIDVRYNTGLAIATNGRELSRRLDELCRDWPVSLQRIDVVAHSMGGLVLRHACIHAEATGAPWRARLRHVVFLGTPHFGSPLERAGHGVDRLLAATPWSAPFASLGRARSAGIVDLRHGLRDVPLPAGVSCHAVAATLASRGDSALRRYVGDGLVPLESALGRHREPARSLAFPRRSQLIAHGTGHIELLSSARIGARIRAWLDD